MIKIKEKKKTLPFDFHEILLNHELELNKITIDIDLIRKLIYLYTV
jgi:hypothetical protein